MVSGGGIGRRGDSLVPLVSAHQQSRMVTCCRASVGTRSVCWRFCGCYGGSYCEQWDKHSTLTHKIALVLPPQQTQAT